MSSGESIPERGLRSLSMHWEAILLPKGLVSAPFEARLGYTFLIFSLSVVPILAPTGIFSGTIFWIHFDFESHKIAFFFLRQTTEV